MGSMAPCSPYRVSSHVDLDPYLYLKLNHIVVMCRYVTKPVRMTSWIRTDGSDMTGGHSGDR